jgi:tRNA pseudouridine13 synthase
MSKAKNTHDVGFKERIVDFVVEEKIPYKLKPHGTWLHVQIEKRNMNTADMVRDVAKILGLKPKQIGIAGLKDKYAIAIQRLCI